MNIVSYKKNLNQGTVQVQVEPPPIPLVKSNNYEKLEKYCVGIKLRRNLTSQKLELYKFKMALFDNGKLEELLLFIRNFNMTLEASVTLVDSANI